MEFLTEYGVFLAQTITIVIAILIVIAAAGSAAMKNKKPEQKEMLVEKVNDKLNDIQRMVYDGDTEMKPFKVSEASVEITIQA